MNSLWPEVSTIWIPYFCSKNIAVNSNLANQKRFKKRSMIRDQKFTGRFCRGSQVKWPDAFFKNLFKNSLLHKFLGMILKLRYVRVVTLYQRLVLLTHFIDLVTTNKIKIMLTWQQNLQRKCFIIDKRVTWHPTDYCRENVQICAKIVQLSATFTFINMQNLISTVNLTIYL